MSLTEATVLVTGASGFLGGALARRLAADGAYVKAFARSAATAPILQNHERIEPVQGDITDPASLSAAVQGCDYVLHSAVAFTDIATQRVVNVEGTRHVMEAAAAANVKRVVHVSTIATYGYNRSGDITEDMPLQRARAEPYNITKIEAEAVVRAVGAERGVSYSIIRPAMIYGPRSGMWTARLFRLARRPILPFVGRGDGSAHPIYVDDVVDLCLVLATHPATDGEAFNCAPDPAPTWRDWLGRYQQMAGRKNNWLALPPALVMGLARGAAAIAPASSPIKDAPDFIQSSQQTFTFKMDKARDLLGWQPQVDLDRGMAHSADWLREVGLLT